MPEHSPCSPSQWAAVAACPSYLPSTGPAHPTANKGTLIHRVIETGVESLLTDPRDLSVAQTCWEYQKEVEAKEQHRGLLKRHTEIRVNVLDEWGHIDLLLQWKDRSIDLFDWKTGWRKVDDVEENDQIKGYALGTWDTFEDYDEIRPHIVIPNRAELSNGVWTRDTHYLEFKARAQLILERRKNLNGIVFNYTPAGCEFCSRKGECPAFLGKTLPLARRYQEDFSLPEEAHPSRITTVEQMSLALKVAKAIKDWPDSVRHHYLTNFVDKGIEAPDFEVRETPGRTAVVNPTAAFDIATKQYGIPPELFIEACSVSFTALADYIYKRAPKGKKDNLRQRFELDLEDAQCLTRGEPRREIRAKR